MNKRQKWIALALVCVLAASCLALAQAVSQNPRCKGSDFTKDGVLMRYYDADGAVQEFTATLETTSEGYSLIIPSDVPEDIARLFCYNRVFLEKARAYSILAIGTMEDGQFTLLRRLPNVGVDAPVPPAPEETAAPEPTAAPKPTIAPTEVPTPTPIPEPTLVPIPDPDPTEHPGDGGDIDLGEDGGEIDLGDGSTDGSENGENDWTPAIL